MQRINDKICFQLFIPSGIQKKKKKTTRISLLFIKEFNIIKKIDLEKSIDTVMYVFLILLLDFPSKKLLLDCIIGTVNNLIYQFLT